MHQAHLLRVADARTACFGIIHNAHCHFQVCCLIRIHMADSGSGLDAWHGRMLHAGANQPFSAPWYQKVYKPFCRHQLICADTGRIFNQADRRARHSCFFQPHLHRFCDCMAAAPCFLPAAQHTGIAAFHRQGGCIARNIRTAFIYNCNHACRNGCLSNHHAVCMNRF